MMLKKLIRQMLAAQTVSALTVSLCLLIDNIMIGQFLGNEALAAYILANPVLLVIGALGSMLCAGAQVACGKSLGKGLQEETNAGYSSVIGISIVFSVVFVLAVVIFRVPLARILGAATPGLLEKTSRYMAGFAIGAPASMGALILVPFLQMAGQSNLLIAAVLGMTVADVGLDLLNVLVFHGGMFGMGLASSLSYYIAIIIGGWYFLSKKCTFRFSFSLIRLRKIKELIVSGAPTIVGMAGSVILILIMNQILLAVSGSVAVAAFSAVTTLGNASNCISTGVSGVSLTLSGILYHEEDQNGLYRLVKLLVRYAAILGASAAVLLIIFAPAFVSLFIREPGECRSLAVLGLRLFALGLIPCCINNALRSCYQGIGRIGTMEIIAVLENAVFPVLCALLFGSLAGVKGVWFYFISGEVLTLAGILLFVWLKKRKVTFSPRDILMLPADFGVPEEDLLEEELFRVEDVMEYARKADDFCLARSQDRRIRNHLVLCIEEMGVNIITYGFADGKKQHRLYIRLQYRKNNWVLRFRDDCGAFDPVSHIPQEGDPGAVGILLTMHMADEARYTYSMNLNNLTLVLKES